MANKELLIVLRRHETRLDSIKNDVFTFGCLIGSIAVGKWIGSDALQWIAGFGTVLTVICLPVKNRYILTASEARAKLDEWEKSDGN